MQIGAINLYDPDLHKIPEYNWQKFQRCMLLDAGIGSTTQDVIKRADTIATMAVNERKEDLDNELTSLKLSLYSALEGINYDTMAFACLVIDIAGKTYPIVTDTDIRDLSTVIGETEILHSEIDEYVQLLKKKLMRN